MKTIQDIYKDIVSSEHGRRLFAEMRERIITTVAEDAEYPEKVPATFDSLIGKLARKKTNPPSDCYFLSYTAIDTDGSRRLRLPLFNRESITDLGIIKPWENINADGLDASTIIRKLSCLSLLPICYSWDNMSVREVLCAYVFPGQTSDIVFLEELLLRIMYAKVEDYGIYDSPLGFLDNRELPMPTKLNAFKDKESAQIRETQLLSFLNMYQAMKNARRELIKSDRNAPDAIQEMVIEKNSILCLRCRDEIVSTDINSMVSCRCGSCSASGGNETLLRYCINDICWIDTSIIKSRIALD